MIILYPGYSFETLATDCSAEDAGQLLAYWSAAFHPALLEKYNEIPRWESASMPPYSTSEQPVCVPPCCESYLQEDWIQRHETEGGLIVRELTDRKSITEKLFQLAGIDEGGNKNGGFDDEYTSDCRSLAAAYFLTDLLVRQLHYMSMMDDSQCSAAVFDSLKAYRSGNRESAYDYLRQAFEAVCQSKEYFYPIHSYFVDLTLITAESVAGSLKQLAEGRGQKAEQTADGSGSKVPFNFLLPAGVLDAVLQSSGGDETIALLKQCCTNGVQLIADNTVDNTADNDGKVSVPNLAQHNLPLQLLPLLDVVESVVRRRNIYKELLDVSPVVFGMLNAGMTTFLPQILKLAGYKGVILFAPLDGWQLDEKAQSKILWQGSDGTKIDALVRYPLNVSEDKVFFELAEKLGETINNDNVPTAVFARFPSQYSFGQDQTGSFWADDLQRMSRFTNGLGEFVSIEKYFEENANNGAVKRFGIDTFQAKVPFDVLSEDVRNNAVNPISKWNKVWKNSTEKNIRSAFAAILALIGKETGRETGKETIVRPDKNETLPENVKAFAEVLTAHKNNTENHTGGIIIFNPWGLPRRVFLDISDWEVLPEETAPVVLAKESDGRKEIIVDVPPLGYAFIKTNKEAAASALAKQPAAKRAFTFFSRPVKDETETLIRLVKNTVKGKNGKEEIQNAYLLQNEFFNIKIDAATGILRSLHTDKTRYNLLSQQLAFRLPKELRLKDGRGSANPNYGYAVSTADNVTIEQAGPITGRLKIQGRLIYSDNSPDASSAECLAAEYSETVIIRRKSRLIEFHLHLEPKIKCGDKAWDSYFALRRAWNDTSLELRAGIADGLELVNTDRIFSPRLLDLRSKEKEQSLTFLTEGLPFHRLIDGHQLDTLLAVQGETVFDFRYGIGVDMKFPIPAAMEFLAPKNELICEAENAPQNNSSWLFCVEAKNVIALGWEPLFDETGKTVGFSVSLLETENRRAHFELKTFLELAKAVSTDFYGNELKELKTENGSVLIDMHGREILLLKVFTVR